MQFRNFPKYLLVGGDQNRHILREFQSVTVESVAVALCFQLLEQFDVFFALQMNSHQSIIIVARFVRLRITRHLETD